MKKLGIAIFLATIAALLVVTVAFAIFTNGDFETGTFSGWTKDLAFITAGITVGPPPSYTTYTGPSVDDTFIVDAAWATTHFGGRLCDPNTNGTVCLPYAGNDSAVVNYLGDSNNLNKLSQAGLVGSGDVGADGMYHIFFAYAPVLDSGGHPADAQPFMFVRLTRVRAGSPDKVLFDKFSYPSDLNPNWKAGSGGSAVSYMPWQVYDLTYAPAELGPGDTLTLDVVAAGCSGGGHWGYIYIDDFGTTKPGASTAPSLTSVSPAFGPVAGGTAVTLTGTGFTGATAVTIGGHTLLAGSFTVVNDTTITFTTPANPAIVVDVSITNPGGSAVKANGFTYYVIPTITGGDTGGGTAPNAGPVTGGTNVVITGTGLVGGAFTFDATTVDCIVNYAGTQATCPSPAHAAGAVDVVVTNPVGSSTSVGGFTYYEVPTITDGSIAPNYGPVTGGTSVSISGTNFIGTSSVTFGGTAANLAACSVAATSITCSTPAHAAGAVDVVVTTPGGSATSVDGFTYYEVPTITGGSTGGGTAPNAGPVAGGTSVTISGTNFFSITSITFGGTAANRKACSGSGTSITCPSPEHAAGVVDVVVTTPGGSATSTGGFTYYEVPTITGGGIAPGVGPVTGGTSVTISGTNFIGTTSVTFGGTEASLAGCSVAATSITCSTPAHAAGTVDVVVTTPGGSATSVGGFTYYEMPTITGGSTGGGIAPDVGPVTGGTSVTISGTNFIGTTSVTFGGTEASLAGCSVAATSITCSTPAHAAGAVDVVVTTPGGTAVSTGGFIYFYTYYFPFMVKSGASG